MALSHFKANMNSYERIIFFYFRIPPYELSISIVRLIAAHPYIKPGALFMIHRIQVYHTLKHVTLDEKTGRNAFSFEQQ